MHHTGTQRLKTERLTLRPLQANDAEAMFHNWAGDPKVTKYLSWPTYKSVMDAKLFLQNRVANYPNKNFYDWGIVLTQSQTLIGTISVVAHDDQVKSMEIGYCIGQAFWGHEYVKEAFKAVIQYLFENTDVNRIEARHDTHNPNSGKVMQKCGLQFEGVLRQAHRNNQGIVDDAVYAILRQDYE
ncbi:GNAT family N-acetyltransferase [Lactobacillus sp. CC-MHH1034]|uniref:GNAT family N-acetyltransferase n=1 Tax=Agrilactobacillus fermenti TaxID=2586909 RepID=UPI001E38946F|nr:GNAT family N-acetyltransferase [Agrilactobacillus fermenti]MCD2256898.1 GNAT family N-acetyltransferase [Agrilactobacillus fermenti]